MIKIRFYIYFTVRIFRYIQLQQLTRLYIHLISFSTVTNSYSYSILYKVFQINIKNSNRRLLSLSLFLLLNSLEYSWLSKVKSQKEYFQHLPCSSEIRSISLDMHSESLINVSLLQKIVSCPSTYDVCSLLDVLSV